VETERAWQALGGIRYGASDAEKKSIQFRRSIYFVKDVVAGETLTEAHVRIIRPGMGLAPKHLENVIGRKPKVDVRRGTPVSWDLLA
jgi:sialic acid synthase SpsE